MRTLLLVVFGLLVWSTPAAAQSPTPDALIGTWKVDLRPTPDAEPYFQDFVVTAIDGAEIRGSFYGSEIQQSAINSDWGAVRIAFTTQDGSGVYHTSAVLDGDVLTGTTHSVGRRFLSFWTAERPR